MSTEHIVACILWFLSTWGCAGIFYLAGGFAKHADYPVHFYAGDEIPKENCKDIPAYNKELSHIWNMYSLPLLVTGITFIWFPVISAVAMGVSMLAGGIWLVKKYRKIAKKYLHS